MSVSLIPFYIIRQLALWIIPPLSGGPLYKEWAASLYGWVRHSPLTLKLNIIDDVCPFESYLILNFMNAWSMIIYLWSFKNILVKYILSCYNFVCYRGMRKEKEGRNHRYELIRYIDHTFSHYFTFLLIFDRMGSYIHYFSMAIMTVLKSYHIRQIADWINYSTIVRMEVHLIIPIYWLLYIFIHLIVYCPSTFTPLEFVKLRDINMCYAIKQPSAIKPPGCTAPPFLTSNFVNGRSLRDLDPNHIVICNIVISCAIKSSILFFYYNLL